MLTLVGAMQRRDHFDHRLNNCLPRR